MGNLALPLGRACVQIALGAAVSGRVVGDRRCRLPDVEYDRNAMATVSEHGIYDLAARYTLRDSIDALAGDQRREAARSGRERIAC